MTAPRFVVTVDVEDFFLPRPPCETYRAILNGTGYGTPMIMDLLEEVEGRGTFFVDVYNRTTVSEEGIAETLREIVARGHEAALHTHPAFPQGQRGYGMAQTMQTYDAAEQKALVAEGVRFFEAAIGRRPKSHRAGGYGANADTLRALADNGIFIDSSQFHGYPYCGLNAQAQTINAPARRDGVLEVPVSVTRCDLTVGSRRWGPGLVSMVKKLDPDWCSPGEIVRQTEALLRTGTKTIVLFMHSYSFLDLNKGFCPDHRAIAGFRSCLHALKRQFGIPFVTLEDACATLSPAPVEGERGDEPLPVVRSDLLWRDRELTAWLLRRVRLRHFLVLLRQKRAGKAAGDTQ